MADQIDGVVQTNGVEKISPYDPRLQHRYQEINGHRWHYVDVLPSVPQRGTVVLIHGFPDIWLAWRYQVPMLLKLGLRCIMLDCMGYDQTGYSPDLTQYTFASHANAVTQICKANHIHHIILGGHDWGGAVVYRVAAYCPDLVTHVFSVATPYFPITEKYLSNEDLAGGSLPNFGYQILLASEDRKVEKACSGEREVRRFLKAAYGGKIEGGKKVFWTPEGGPDLEIVKGEVQIGMTPLLSDEELNYYVAAFCKNGMEGPCNWYRTRKVNHDADRALFPDQGVKQPTLFIQCLKDNILIPKMSRGMEKAIPNLTRGEVNASHWALWHTPKETNDLIRGWIEKVAFAGKSKI